jgi:adenine deaminase
MWRWQWRRRVAIAQGTYFPTLSIRGGRVLNVFTGELVEADVAVDAGVIVALGAFPEARQVIDATGLIVTPAFVDPHLHLESTLLWPDALASAVVPHGTGTIITDPHELANVGGLAAVEALRAATADLPLDVRFTAPSCVPASAFETPGADYSLADLQTILEWEETVALGEMMNFPGVLAADPGVAEKLWIARGRPIDGHAPGLRGPALQAYAAAGMSSDHESVSLAEAREKLELGLFIMIREGSSEKNLAELLPLVTDATWPRIAFCSDDRDCHDLLTHGHMDATLRQAIALGLDPIRAIQMATWNPAHHWRLDRLGAIAPGYRANLVTLADLETVQVEYTVHDGRLVAEGGALLTPPSPRPAPNVLRQTVRMAPLRLSDLALPPDERRRAVGVIPGQIVTKAVDLSPEVAIRVDEFSIEDDLAKLICVDRHHATGKMGVGLVQGFGLRRGALASSIAHDAHNIVAIGVNDADVLAAVATIGGSDGGLAVVADGQVLAHLPLPIGGLFSDLSAGETAAAYAEVEAAAMSLGSSLHSPFGQLAFLALSVIPEARITDHGFLDLRHIN